MLGVVVLISGSGSNLRALLDATNNPLYPVRVLAVGSDNACSGLEHAELYGIPTFVVAPENFSSREEWAKTLLESVEFFKPELTVLAGFMKILPAEFVRALSPRLINTHPSLLPLYPGAHGVRDALAAGATETGVTIHIVDEGVDTGPKLAQAKLSVLPDETEAELHERIKVIERSLLVSVVKDIAEQRIKLDTHN
ncbi:MAG: phosphoribosylglycinamide formyltransferase [Micrococcales bacterium]